MSCPIVVEGSNDGVAVQPRSRHRGVLRHERNDGYKVPQVVR